MRIIFKGTPQPSLARSNTLWHRVVFLTCFVHTIPPAPWEGPLQMCPITLCCSTACFTCFTPYIPVGITCNTVLQYHSHQVVSCSNLWKLHLWKVTQQNYCGLSTPPCPRSLYGQTPPHCHKTCLPRNATHELQPILSCLGLSFSCATSSVPIQCTAISHQSLQTTQTLSQTRP